MELTKKNSYFIGLNTGYVNRNNAKKGENFRNPKI